MTQRPPFLPQGHTTRKLHRFPVPGIRGHSFTSKFWRSLIQTIVVLSIQHGTWCMFSDVDPTDRNKTEKENFSGWVLVLEGKAGKATVLNRDNRTPNKIVGVLETDRPHSPESVFSENAQRWQTFPSCLGTHHLPGELRVNQKMLLYP